MVLVLIALGLAMIAMAALDHILERGWSKPHAISAPARLRPRRHRAARGRR
jgi:hypothetical protein